MHLSTNFSLPRNPPIYCWFCRNVCICPQTFDIPCSPETFILVVLTPYSQAFFQVLHRDIQLFRIQIFVGSLNIKTSVIIPDSSHKSHTANKALGFVTQDQVISSFSQFVNGLLRDIFELDASLTKYLG